MATLKQNNVRSDGSANDETIALTVNHPETGLPMLNDETGEPDVVVQIRPMTQAEWRRLLKRHEKAEIDPKTRRVERVSDMQAASDDLLKTCVIGWRGIVAADDLPLPCTPETIVELDGRVKDQIVKAALGAEVVETAGASFRAV